MHAPTTANPAPPRTPENLGHPAFWRSLLAPLRALGLARAAPAPACGMGLDGLPQGLGQLPVGTPVALAWQDRPADRLWANALLQDLLHQGPVLLLCEDEARADALLAHPPLQQAHSQGRLLVWCMAAALSRSTQTVNMAGVFDELGQAGLTPAHALVTMASVPAQLGSSVAAWLQWGRQVGNWSRRRTRPVLFVFDAWDSAERVLGPLRSLGAVFEHVAVLGTEPQGATLFVERWNGSDGPQMALRLGLRPDHTGQRLAYDGSLVRGPAQRLVEAPDQQRTLATRAAVAGQRGVPPHWTVVPELADVQPATQGAIAATVLLHAGSTQEHEDLMQEVFQLRVARGRALKIVVLETADKLRSNLEQALLALGANRVVYREVGFARLLRQLDELQGETFVREPATDYALVRAGFMPEALRGYLPPLAFCDSVQAMLLRSGEKGLHHSFVRLTMQPHVAHGDAIQACLALRDGDVLSADHNALYVFMFACAQTDIEPALARLFALAPTELFAEQTVYGSTDSVHTVLRALREAARKGLPDYSAWCLGRRTAGAPATPPPASASVSHRAPTDAPALRLAPVPAAVATAPSTPTVHARPLARRSTLASPGAQAC